MVKVILILVPLPKIDEMYAKLASSSIYSTLNLRNSYYYIALSVQSQRKLASVTPMGNFELWKVPFGLAQAPAYFQWLINEVFSVLNFAFGYLDDILIYSPNAENHLKHNLYYGSHSVWNYTI